MMREVWGNWPLMPPGTWATLVEATLDDIEQWPDYGAATVTLWPPNASPNDAVPLGMPRAASSARTTARRTPRR
jgi:hypothetical protein